MQIPLILLQDEDPAGLLHLAPTRSSHSCRHSMCPAPEVLAGMGVHCQRLWSVLPGSVCSQAAGHFGAVSGCLGNKNSGLCSESSGSLLRKPSSHLPYLLWERLSLKINM